MERVVRMRDIARDGTKIDVEVFSCRIEYGGEMSILATVRDITELKKAENSRLQLEVRLQRAEKMEAVATLAGGVAHDLNNVLCGLVGYPALLLMDLPDDSPLRSAVLAIEDSGKRATAIVQDLLTLARRGVARTEVVNVNRLVESYLSSPEHQRLKAHFPDAAFEVDLDESDDGSDDEDDEDADDDKDEDDDEYEADNHFFRPRSRARPRNGFL